MRNAPDHRPTDRRSVTGLDGHPVGVGHGDADGAPGIETRRLPQFEHDNDVQGHVGRLCAARSRRRTRRTAPQVRSRPPVGILKDVAAEQDVDGGTVLQERTRKNVERLDLPTPAGITRASRTVRATPS